MKKVLFIDPLSSEGHINFNKIYISKLIECNVDLQLVFKEGYINRLGFPTSLVRLSIPTHFYSIKKNGLINRICLFRIFVFIKRKIEFDDYDFVIFSSYEAISLFFSNIRHKLVLINHNNISGLENNVKRFFFRLISKGNLHLVFEKFIQEYLFSIGIKDVIVVPHGLPTSFDYKSVKSCSFINGIINNEKFKYILFSPASSSVDGDFIRKLLNSEKFVSYLEKKNILLIVKGNFISLKTKNIIILKDYLTTKQYQFLFLKSSAILLPYPESHKFRISAMFFEGISNNKICFLSDIDLFKHYHWLFNYNPYFKSIDDLISRIDEWMNSKMNKDVYNDISTLMPTFDLLLD